VVANGAALHDLRRRRTTTVPTIRVVCSDIGRGSSLTTNRHAMTTPTLAANQSIERGIGAREAPPVSQRVVYARVIRADPGRPAVTPRLANRPIERGYGRVQLWPVAPGCRRQSSSMCGLDDPEPATGRSRPRDTRTGGDRPWSPGAGPVCPTRPIVRGRACDHGFVALEVAGMSGSTFRLNVDEGAR
jgi:hypothetical protein